MGEDLQAGLIRLCQRTGLDAPSGLERLTGGATMESWRFSAGGEHYVLRRAPSLEFMEGRPFGHDTEAAIIAAAFRAGVSAPEVVAQLAPEDAMGSGFIMRALPGTPNPKAILEMDNPGALLEELARDLAKIHAIERGELPSTVPELDYRTGIAEFRARFEEAGGDRPIIALGIKWLEDNCPDPCAPVLNHGDYRLGNFLAQDSKLTGVLDWELAHWGDHHEDLAFGCMAVWRFARYDRPALGLGTLEAYFSAYEQASGRKVDPARFRFWTIYRTVWWALGCLKCAESWRDGSDRMLERVVISRRTSEQELDLLMLLEEDAPEAVLAKSKPNLDPNKFDEVGEAGLAEIAVAISEWLTTIKDKMEGHDRFQLAVARNALGIVARQYEAQEVEGYPSWKMANACLIGQVSLTNDWKILHLFRQEVLEKVSIDSPKYPSLAAAIERWGVSDWRDADVPKGS